MFKSKREMKTVKVKNYGIFAKWRQQEKCILKTKRCGQRPPKGEIHSFKCFWVETKYYNQFSIYCKKLEQEKSNIPKDNRMMELIFFFKVEMTELGRGKLPLSTTQQINKSYFLPVLNTTLDSKRGKKKRTLRASGSQPSVNKKSSWESLER